MPVVTGFDLLPDARERFQDLHEALYDEEKVDPVLVELCRLRVNQIIGCDAELEVRTPAAMGAGLTEETIAELRQWPSSPRFGETERAVLGLAEQIVIDASGVSVDDVVEVRKHLSDPEVTALAVAVAMFDANARFRVALGV
jgi:AhpD family alkylhydroperoxidase